MGWWEKDTCRYLQWRELHKPLAKATIEIHKKCLGLHLKDFFGKYQLDEITPLLWENWFLYMLGKGLKARSINIAFATLRLMLDEAVHRELLKNNVTLGVKMLKEEVHERVIFTLEEVRALFPQQWDTIWDNYVIYITSWTRVCYGKILF